MLSCLQDGVCTEEDYKLLSSHVMSNMKPDWSDPSSVAMAIADVFRNNGISVGKNLAKILKIFEKIDEAKGQRVI